MKYNEEGDRDERDIMLRRFQYIRADPRYNKKIWQETRWTGILAEKLYDKGYRIIEGGLCGRTSVFDDATRDGRNGAKVLPMLLETHAPLDQVVLMLGTNDCKTYNHASADRIGKGIEKLIQQIRKADPAIDIFISISDRIRRRCMETRIWSWIWPAFCESIQAIKTDLFKDCMEVWMWFPCSKWCSQAK